MNPITAKATELRVLTHHAGALQIQLSKLNQGLRLAGVDPESNHHHKVLVEAIRSVHTAIGAMTTAEMYLDNRGLTP